jgi:hypothetical protein
MKGNEISTKELRADAVEWLAKTAPDRDHKDYGKGSVRNYYPEITFAIIGSWPTTPCCC